MFLREIINTLYLRYPLYQPFIIQRKLIDILIDSLKKSL